MLSEKYENLSIVANANKQKYQENRPFPNIVFSDFFDADFLQQVLDEFPDLSEANTAKFNNPNENKIASKGEDLFGNNTRNLIHFLNSQPFLDFLTVLTGIENLIPDPFLLGGGLHESKKGGFLKIHADFNKHRLTKLDRRLNVLIYLNKNWHDSYGGHFELWDRDMKNCEVKIRPDFNTMALFSTTSTSYHGLPDPINCPDNMSRKSIALYYYTNGRPASEILEFKKNHGTIFRNRKEDVEMLKFNRMKNFVEDVLPPFLFRTIKKIRNN
ncbi:2OG-Fe(II) oxygenase [Galbibacter mesophilus]|uniref:2OG-Fe(II) oxygenase n=1 Tax=Galbibacter mesophilus TaxID=379069 RepID=UPI00191EBF09|nr:2OG-Fe(II) oxygenase [Galbibacter mesophilus]MCM5663485.1 2OG-Fe(II) oxygenase [Galbibacter mesophilus]